MWNVILTAGYVICAALAFYLASRVHRCSFIQSFGRKHRAAGWLVSFLLPGAAALFALINPTTMLVVLLHLAVFFALCDLAAFIIRKAGGRDFGYDAQSIAALLITVVYLGIGWYLAHHVFVTEYTFTTDKALPKTIRVVEIADSHLGITLDGESFAGQMKRVQETQPDLVVVVGDFVDDDSSREDMEAACRALGQLETTYGVYFVYGNHDKGYFRYRSFSAAELREELLSNNVVILEDESVLIDDSFYVIGRRDRSFAGRTDIKELMSALDPERYSIVLDHQPNDYANEAAAGADLVLSGHTHGGHLFPLKYLGEWSGANDLGYGTIMRDKTNFVVTSGISGWAVPFKTGTASEFVVIDIAPAK